MKGGRDGLFSTPGGLANFPTVPQHVPKTIAQWVGLICRSDWGGVCVRSCHPKATSCLLGARQQQLRLPQVTPTAQSTTVLCQCCVSAAGTVAPTTRAAARCTTLCWAGTRGLLLLSCPAQVSRCDAESLHKSPARAAPAWHNNPSSMQPHACLQATTCRHQQHDINCCTPRTQPDACSSLASAHTAPLTRTR